MKKELIEKFSQTLNKHKDSLINLIDNNTDQKKLLLGPSNIDDVYNVVVELKESLEKLKKGEFGKCKVCSGNVEIEQLLKDCTTEICLDHYTEDELRKLERDLELAAKVQKKLLPDFTPSLPGVQISVFNKAADIVGGDYFDFFSCPDTGQGIVVADVMGKGLPASMLMSNLQATTRILGPENNCLAVLAKRINELFLFNANLMSFISLVLIKIDIENKIVKYSNAGHNPPLLWKSADKSIIQLNPTGPAIGLIKNPEYKSETISIESGDILLIYTDGLTEARNGQKTEFGKDRLIDSLGIHTEKTSDEILEALKEDVNSFAGEFNDDVTMVVLKFD